jgi:hypothetical protein
MYAEARKINLIEAVLKVDNETTLEALEMVLKKSKKSKAKKTSIYDLVGIWSNKDTAIIKKVINETCEQIHEDDWK